MKTLTLILCLSACTDATRSRLAAYGDSAEVKCYSGGTLIYDGKSTGRISSPKGSDGWQFRDAKTQRLVEVSGDCIITI